MSSAAVKFDRGLADLPPGLQDALRIAHRADPRGTERALESDGSWAVSRDLKLDGQIEAGTEQNTQLGLPLVERAGVAAGGSSVAKRFQPV